LQAEIDDYITRLEGVEDASGTAAPARSS